MNSVFVRNRMNASIRLGKRGENEATRILFPMLSGMDTAVLLHKRNGDEHPYSASTSIITENGARYIQWIVSSTDVGKSGIGEAEIAYYKSGRIAKSVRYETVTEDCLDDGVTVVPTAAQAWVQSVTDKTAQAESAKTAAAASATSASTYASQASASAVQAALSASSAQTYAGDAGTAKTAAETARDAAQAAQQSASASATVADDCATLAEESATAAAASATSASASATSAAQSAAQVQADIASETAARIAADALKADASTTYTKSQADAKFLTQHQDISGKANVGASYTKQESDDKYLTQHQSLSAYRTSAAQDSIDAGKATTSDVTAETAARTAADAILTAQAQSLTRSLDFLWKLNRGISYTFETDETAAYSKTVPTGAKVCDVRSVGGHSEVIDGEIVSADVTAIDIVRADDSTTIQIPAAVRALEGYGWSAGTVFNEVDFANKKFIKRVDKVDLGECTWGHNGTNADGSTQFITRSVEDRALSTNGICDIFPIGNTVDGYINLRINSYAFTANTSGYTSPTVFRTAMSGHYLYYELATPIETDISSLLTDSTEDITVESGGTITMEQDGTQLAVPSKVEYLIALNEVTE